MRTTPAILAATVVLAGCGSSAHSPEDQVRDAARNVAAAVSSPHPERACAYMTDHDSCVGSIAVANSMHLEVAAAVGLPADWRSRIEKTPVKVTGAAALFGRAHYVRRGGQWLLDNG